MDVAVKNERVLMKFLRLIGNLRQEKGSEHYGEPDETMQFAALKLELYIIMPDAHRHHLL
jgi:hypothetical protein